VVQLAKQRLKLEGATKQDKELQPGGKYDGRPVDWALNKYVFFECSKCHLPYFGGARECGAAAAAGAPGAWQR
jgi:E3 ubiquitin-protein ligase MYCBP2